MRKYPKDVGEIQAVEISQSSCIRQLKGAAFRVTPFWMCEIAGIIFCTR